MIPPTVPNASWARARPQVGFACDVCGGRHTSTYSCSVCGAWVCVRHADITITRQEYAPPIKKVKCRGCIR